MHFSIPIDNQESLEIITIVSEMFGQNAFLIRKSSKRECVIVDPSFDVESLLGHVANLELTVSCILNTHGHIDHIVGNREVKDRYPYSPLIIGEDDAFKLLDPEANLSAGYGLKVISPAADKTVVHGEVLSYAGLAFETRLTPGHSPGHVVWVCRDAETPVVINGDVLFQGSVGRTDFSDGSFEDLEHSIRSQLYSLSDETIVLTGHGNPTTIGQEKKSNPFVPGQ